MFHFVAQTLLDRIHCCKCGNEDCNRPHKFCFKCGYFLGRKDCKRKQRESAIEENRKIVQKLVSQRYTVIPDTYCEWKKCITNLLHFMKEYSSIKQVYINSMDKLVSNCNLNFDNKILFSAKHVLSDFVDEISVRAKEEEKWISMVSNDIITNLEQELESIDYKLEQFATTHHPMIQELIKKWQSIASKVSHHKIASDIADHQRRHIFQNWKLFVSENNSDFVDDIQSRIQSLQNILSSETLLSIDIAHREQTVKCEVLQTISKLNVQSFVEEFQNNLQSQPDTYQSVISSAVDIKCLNNKRMSVVSMMCITPLTENSDFNIVSKIKFDAGADSSFLEDSIANVGMHDDINIYERTRRHGICWFSTLMMNEKKCGKWNLSDSEWNVAVFEQIILEYLSFKHRRKIKSDAKPMVINREQLLNHQSLNHIRLQFKISVVKYKSLIVLIENAWKTVLTMPNYDFAINSVIFRIKCLKCVHLSNFDNELQKYQIYIKRQLSFILSCMMWYVLEYPRSFWKIADESYTKLDLFSSLITNAKSTSIFCKKQALIEQVSMKNGKMLVWEGALSPIDNLLFVVQDISHGLGSKKQCEVPNAIHHKIYSIILNLCVVHTRKSRRNCDTFSLGLSFSSMNDNYSEQSEEKTECLLDKCSTQQSYVSRFYSHWTEIADFIFKLSDSMDISLEYHAFLFLEVIFTQLLDKNINTSTAGDDLRLRWNGLHELNQSFCAQIHTTDTNSLLSTIEDTVSIAIYAIEKLQYLPPQKSSEDDAETLAQDVLRVNEETHIRHIIHHIQQALYRWLSNYELANPLVVSKLFIIYRKIFFIKNMCFFRDESSEVLMNKLMDFVVVSTSQMADRILSEYAIEENLSHLDPLNLQFSKQLHDQIRWHKILDENYFLECRNGDSTVSCNYPFSETFLLMWMNKYSNIVHSPLNDLKNQDLSNDSLHVIDLVGNFISTTRKYKHLVSNSEDWNQALPSLKQVCVPSFHQLVLHEFEPKFKQCLDKFMENHQNQLSSIALFNKLQYKQQISENSNNKSNEKKISVHKDIQDLCEILNFYTKLFLKYSNSLYMYDLDDTRFFFKVISKQLNRIVRSICKSIPIQISVLLPPPMILSKILTEENSKDNNQQSLSDENIGIYLRYLISQMNILSFILNTIKNVKKTIINDYQLFIRKKIGTYFLHREITVEINKNNLDIIMIPEQRETEENNFIAQGAVIANITSKTLMKRYDLRIGFQLISIDDLNCEKMEFDHILRIIHHHENNAQNESANLVNMKFRFRLKSVADVLFFNIENNFLQGLQQLSRLFACQAIYGSLRNDCLIRLYQQPLNANRLSSLKVIEKVFAICDPLLEVMNKEQFIFCMQHIFCEIIHVVIYQLLHNTRQCIGSSNDKQKNNQNKYKFERADYQIIYEDIQQMLSLFKNDINDRFLSKHTKRIMNILQMIQLTSNHLIHHSMECAEHWQPLCMKKHKLKECLHSYPCISDIVLPRNLKSKKDMINFFKCHHCQLTFSVKENGFYYCGKIHECRDIYCMDCCNRRMLKQLVDESVQRIGSEKIQMSDKNVFTIFDVICMLNKKSESDAKQYVEDTLNILKDTQFVPN